MLAGHAGVDIAGSDQLVGIVAAIVEAGVTVHSRRFVAVARMPDARRQRAGEATALPRRMLSPVRMHPGALAAHQMVVEALAAVNIVLCLLAWRLAHPPWIGGPRAALIGIGHGDFCRSSSVIRRSQCCRSWAWWHR